MTTAVILFNLGGPNSPEDVEPFLFNLFKDPAIIRLPNPFRYLLAKLISKKRLKEAQENYHHLGGFSPLLENTKAQAQALEKALGKGYKVLISMRYAAPRAHEVVHELKTIHNLSSIIFLPLYPQFSTSTTASSFKDLSDTLRGHNFPAPIVSCCYPTHPMFIQSWQNLLRKALSKNAGKSLRILFSAHGIPEKFVTAGDPYPIHVEATVRAVMNEFQGVDYSLCYQSRVGPLKWIGPSIEEELVRAGNDRVGVLVVPIAFVSEHSETLVELDIQYRDRSIELGIPFYERVPTLSTEPEYIKCLVDLVHGTGKSINQPCQKTACWGTKCMTF